MANPCWKPAVMRPIVFASRQASTVALLRLRETEVHVLQPIEPPVHLPGELHRGVVRGGQSMREHLLKAVLRVDCIGSVETLKRARNGECEEQPNQGEDGALDGRKARHAADALFFHIPQAEPSPGIQQAQGTDEE